jgi:predicted amidohydrolase
MTRILAAVGQLCSTANIARNTRLCTSIIRRAAAAQAQLVYLPEATSSRRNRQMYRDWRNRLREEVSLRL